MHLERVIRIINLLDVPEKKRRFWPQRSAIVVDSRTRTVIDVIQHFGENSLYIAEDNRKYYPSTRMFFVEPGWYKTVEALKDKIEWCFEPNSENTYIVGKGLVGNLPDDEKEKYHRIRASRDNWFSRLMKCLKG